jgi:hypothetical protein
MRYSEKEMEKYPLHLLTIKTPKIFLNSSHANIDYLINKKEEAWREIIEGRIFSSANALTNDLLTDMGRGSAIQEVKVK